jgi:predicted phage tail protein
LHLGVDWISLLTHWIEFGVALALDGVIVGWFTEEYMGIVGGGVVLTILLLVGNLVASLIGNVSATLTVQSFITVVPLIGASILLAGAIRMAINRHLHIKQQETPEVRRKRFMQLTIIVFLVGLIPGLFSRFGQSSEFAIRTLNESLQNVATDPSLEVRFPIAKVPALRDHFGMDYTLYARASTFEAGALDITIRFIDGFTVTHLVPTESGYALFLQVCNEVTKIASP